MNNVHMIGRLTRDPDVKYFTKDDKQETIARMTIAVARRKGGADFIPCIAFGKTGELIEKYFKKGMLIGVTGRMNTSSYVKESGERVNTFQVIISDFEFLEKKAAIAESENNIPDITEVPKGIDQQPVTEERVHNDLLQSEQYDIPEAENYFDY